MIRAVRPYLRGALGFLGSFDFDQAVVADPHCVGPASIIGGIVLNLVGGPGRAIKHDERWLVRNEELLGYFIRANQKVARIFVEYTQ